MRAIDADAISYESIDSCDTGRHEHYYGTGIIAVRKEDIDAMPTIQPEPHWIPVTKDTPKEADTYMCTCSDAGRRIVTLVKWQPRTKTWCLTGARAYWQVVAWCKRPEPYKGEGRNEML